MFSFDILSHVSCSPHVPHHPSLGGGRKKLHSSILDPPFRLDEIPRIMVGKLYSYGLDFSCKIQKLIAKWWVIIFLLFHYYIRTYPRKMDFWALFETKILLSILTYHLYEDILNKSHGHIHGWHKLSLCTFKWCPWYQLTLNIGLHVCKLTSTKLDSLFKFP